MRIALLPGHSQRSEGAEMCCGHFKGYGEWRLASEYIPQVAQGLRNLGYDVVQTQRSEAGGTTPSYSAYAANATGADIALEFHFNSASAKARGGMVMHWGKSAPGRKFAKLLAEGITELIGVPLLGDGTLAVPTPDNRGTEAFRKSRMPFYMLEPCFAGSNEADCMAFTQCLPSGEWEMRLPGIIDKAIRKIYG